MYRLYSLTRYGIFHGQAGSSAHVGMTMRRVRLAVRGEHRAQVLQPPQHHTYTMDPEQLRLAAELIRQSPPGQAGDVLAGEPVAEAA